MQIFFFFGSALENRAPRGVRYRLAGFGEIVGKGGFGPATVVFSWLVVTDSEVGHWAFFVPSFWRLVHSDFQALVILAVLIGAARELIANGGGMFLIPISCW